MARRALSLLANVQVVKDEPTEETETTEEAPKPEIIRIKYDDEEEDGADMPQLIPVFGGCISNIVGLFLVIFNLLIAATIWMTMTGVSWLFYRPQVGALLCLGALVCSTLAVAVKRKFGGK